MSRRVWLSLSALGVLAAGLVAGGKYFGAFEPAVQRLDPSLAIIPNDLLNAADPAMGALTFKGCAACHSNERNGPRMVGPPLFGIVGAPIASSPGYAYSDALLQFKHGYWTTDELYDWLKDPSAYAPGTTMTFDGLLDPQDRMDLIAYLITLK